MNRYRTWLQKKLFESLNLHDVAWGQLGVGFVASVFMAESICTVLFSGLPCDILESKTDKCCTKFPLNIFSNSSNRCITANGFASAVSLKDVEEAAHSECMNSIRAYLALVRHMDFAIEQPMTAFLENQLVEARKAQKDLDASTMHTWLTVKSNLWATPMQSPWQSRVTANTLDFEFSYAKCFITSSLGCMSGKADWKNILLWEWIGMYEQFWRYGRALYEAEWYRSWAVLYNSSVIPVSSTMSGRAFSLLFAWYSWLAWMRSWQGFWPWVTDVVNWKRSIGHRWEIWNLQECRGSDHHKLSGSRVHLLKQSMTLDVLLIFAMQLRWNFSSLKRIYEPWRSLAVS